MDSGDAELSAYDNDYLAGILHFNQGDFFEAHEVWEDLWARETGDSRRFVQGLIQAAVGLCHLINGNRRGAEKLRKTSKAYMEGLSSPCWGLGLDRFWHQVDRCYDMTIEHQDRGLEIPDEFLPTIELRPEPHVWPEHRQHEDDA